MVFSIVPLDVGVSGSLAGDLHGFVDGRVMGGGRQQRDHVVRTRSKDANDRWCRGGGGSHGQFGNGAPSRGRSNMGDGVGDGMGGGEFGKESVELLDHGASQGMFDVLCGGVEGVQQGFFFLFGSVFLLFDGAGGAGAGGAGGFRLRLREAQELVLKKVIGGSGGGFGRRPFSFVGGFAFGVLRFLGK